MEKSKEEYLEEFEILLKENHDLTYDELIIILENLD